MVAIEIADDVDDEHINSSQPLTTIASESQFPDLVRRTRKMKGKGIAMAQHLDLDNSANDATNDGDDDDDEIQIVEQLSSSTLPTVKLNHLGMGTAIKKSTRQPLTCNLLKNLSQTTSKQVNNGVNPLVKRQRQVINSIESETSSVTDESTREVLNLNISNNSINANSVQSKKRIRPPRANKKLLTPIGSNKRKPKKPRIADDDPNNPSPFFVLCQAAKMHQNSSANATNECTTSSSENNSSRGSMEINPGTGTPSSRRLAAAVKLFTKSNTDPSSNAALDKNGTKNSANDQIVSEHEHGGQMKNNNNERAAAVVGPRLRQHLQQNAQQQHGPLPSLTTGPSKGTCFTFSAPDFSSSGGNAVGRGRRLIAPSDITTICGQQQPWQLPTSTQRLRIIAAPFEDENVYQTRLRIMTAREARDNLWIAFLEAICNDVTFNQATDANDSEEEKCAKRFDIRFPRECCKYLNDTTVDSLVGVIYKWIDEWMTVDGRPAKELRSFTHSTKNRWALTWAIPQLCIYYLKKSTNISAAEAKRMFLAAENTSITASTAHI